MQDKIVVYSVYGVVIAILVAVAGVACSNFYEKLGMSHDNPAEEHIEELIEQETGLQIDLTPESKERPE